MCFSLVVLCRWFQVLNAVFCCMSRTRDILDYVVNARPDKVCAKVLC